MTTRHPSAMERRTHPTHARSTRLIMLVLLAITAASWMAAYCAQESLQDQALVNVFVPATMGAGALLMACAVARDLLCRCPQCRRWLRSRGRASTGGTRVFTCTACGASAGGALPEGAALVYYPIVPSTIDLAGALAEQGCADSTIVVADEAAAGQL